MKPIQFKTMRQRLQNRRKGSDDLRQPVPLPYDPTTISPHEMHVARYRAQDALTGEQTDEVPRTVRRKRSRVLR